MDLIYYSIFLVSAAIGTGSSFISDVFFIFSFKNHKLKVHEIKILSRLQFTCIVSAILAIISRIILLALQIEANVYIHESLQYSMILILGVILVSTIVLRRFHIPALLRHQQKYTHLSESFKEHHDALITTSALNLISWIFVLILVAIENHSLVLNLPNLGFIKICISYVILAFLSTQIAQQIKGFYKAF